MTVKIGPAADLGIEAKAEKVAENWSKTTVKLVKNDGEKAEKVAEKPRRMGKVSARRIRYLANI